MIPERESYLIDSTELNDDELYVESVKKQLADDSSEPVFLTGDAGTGKTTLMHWLKEKYEGRCIVVAPTGKAAINVGGATIHSFFGFPARTVNYKSIKTLMREKPTERELEQNPNLYIAYEKDQNQIKIIEASKILIIDEISMVRADLMDQIAWYFHKNFPGKPFGGLKVVMVGDLDQLPPVVGTDEEWEMLNARYDSPFFLDAKCWSSWSKFKTIRLTKVWRQKDPEFVSFLNAIKNNRVTAFQIQQFNDTVRSNENDGVLLCSTNKIAAEFNNKKIQELQGRLIQLNGRITGEFQDKNCPVEKVIEVKIGAKVMIVRNGANYVNGTVGTLEKYDKENESISIKIIDRNLEKNGITVTLKPYEFESVEYTYNEREDKIKSRSGGKFVQFPIKLAYAISVHKSQGDTYEQVTIDLGERGAFSHGQAYVALSRCTSIAGTAIKRDLKHKDFIYDKRVLKFNREGQ